MGWRNFEYYLAAGASGRYWVSWPPPGDRGPQWLIAHPVAGEPPCLLEVSEHGKEIDYRIVGAVAGGESVYRREHAYYRYLVTVTNRGPNGAVFNFEGGRADG